MEEKNADCTISITREMWEAMSPSEQHKIIENIKRDIQNAKEEGEKWEERIKIEEERKKQIIKLEKQINKIKEKRKKYELNWY